MSVSYEKSSNTDVTFVYIQNVENNLEAVDLIIQHAA